MVFKTSWGLYTSSSSLILLSGRRGPRKLTVTRIVVLPSQLRWLLQSMVIWSPPAREGWGIENTVSVDACRLATFNVFNGLFLDVAGAKRAVSPGAMTDASVPANNYRSQPQYGSMVRSTTIFFLNPPLQSLVHFFVSGTVAYGLNKSTCVVRHPQY